MSSKMADYSSYLRDDEIAVKMVILTMKNYQSCLSNQKIRCIKLFGKQANVLKTNMRYTYPAVQRRDYRPPVGPGLAPLRPTQLRKLRLIAEEDRNEREQKRFGRQYSEILCNIMGQHFNGVERINKSSARI